MAARGPVLLLEEDNIQDVTGDPGILVPEGKSEAGSAREDIREEPQAEPPWRRYAVAAPEVPEGFSRVVVIIDDLGVDRKRSRAILELPGPLTAAFLPYATQVAPLVEEARAKGHEILIHMPMEPMGEDLDLGSIALRSDMKPAAFDAMLAQAFAAFEGYVGMNNHMGSKLTQDRGAMERLMGRLYENGLLFVDSRTIGKSVAGKVAADHAVPHIGRDVFLDHDPHYEGVVESLQRVENVARKQGIAVAIGHPKDHTIRALTEWLPTLAEKKLVLVPVSAVVTVTPEEKNTED